jgi:hypothetical protein
MIMANQQAVNARDVTAQGQGFAPVQRTTRWSDQRRPIADGL